MDNPKYRLTLDDHIISHLDIDKQQPIIHKVVAEERRECVQSVAPPLFEYQSIGLEREDSDDLFVRLASEEEKS